MAKVAVIGSGLMGQGIAQSAASAGHDVNIIDISNEALDRAKNLTNKLLRSKVKKGKLGQADAEDILSRMKFNIDYSTLSSAEIAIEVVPEKLEIKREIYRQINTYSKDTCLVLSNTSGINIDTLAESISHPDMFLGMHFFYPAPVMKLVELIPGKATCDQAYSTAIDFAKSLGKITIKAPNQPGFIVNRIIVPYQNEGAFLVQEGCTPEDVDAGMKLGCNHPMGPCELMDFTGIDVVYATMNGLYEQFGDEKYRPCPLLKEMIEKGYLGRKSGRGFYTYE